ncbi:MAG: hypothetical protein HXX19_07015 [Rhodoferax sp.]|nr:hypothetical protein [Rhodoferax sp.]
MKNWKLRVLVAVAACTLSMASLAAAHVTCKSGQKPAAKGSQTCVPASTAQPKTASKTAAKSPVKGKTVVRSAATSKGKTKTTVKGKAHSRHGASAITQAPLPAATALPANLADADCDSTQTLLQGGAAQCTALGASTGLGLLTQTQANPGAACFAALAASQASRQLASRVPFLSDSAPSPEALANRGVASKRESEELHSVLAGYGMCLDISASWRSQTYAPSLVSLLEAYWREAKSVLGELAAGKKSFGDAARAVADSDKAYKIQIEAMAANLRSRGELPATAH